MCGVLPSLVAGSGWQSSRECEHPHNGTAPMIKGQLKGTLIFCMLWWAADFPDFIAIQYLTLSLLGFLLVVVGFFFCGCVGFFPL